MNINGCSQVKLLLIVYSYMALSVIFLDPCSVMYK
jgi:hypothetical protein